MLNYDTKDIAIRRLRDSVNWNQNTVHSVSSMSIELMEIREGAGESVIKPVEILINNLANSPKEFSDAFDNCRMEHKAFIKQMPELERQKGFQATVDAAIGAGAGIGAGIGVAALAPTAAMAIATTFGTASTGVAISTLTGAAATNAALAWLGGGAIAAGGAGMAGGQTLLAMAGPIGWMIGGTALLGSAIYINIINLEIAEEAISKLKEVESANQQLLLLQDKVIGHLNLTKQHKNGLLEMLYRLRYDAPSDYLKYSQNQKNILLALINNMHSFSSLINQKIN
jgi:hypothetical protein